MFDGQLGRANRQQMVALEVPDELAQTQFLERASGVDQDVAIFFESAKNIDLVQQSRVLNDDRIGLHDRFAQADFLVVHAAISHHWRAGAL